MNASFNARGADGQDDVPGPRARMPRALRIRKQREFQIIRAERQHVRDSLLKLGWRKNGLNRTRLGLAVSRRMGGAVRRNRIKRVLREAFRRQKDLWPQGLDLVVIPLHGDQARRLDLVSASLAKLVAKIERQL